MRSSLVIMSSNYFLKSIKFNNYRGLHGLNIPTFRRINLIGGYNGTGKSSLLEAIFFLADRRGPISLTRPFMWRGLGMNGKDSLDQYFSELDHDKTINISAGTLEGLLDVSMSFGMAPKGVTVKVPGGAGPANHESQQSVSSDIGLNIDVTLNGKPDDGQFSIPMLDGIAFTPYRIGKSKIPPAALLSPSTRNSAQDNANRYSAIVKSNRIPELLKAISIIRPNVSGIQLLQEGGNPVLYAQFLDGKLYPFSMLGDGVQTLFSIVMAIMNTAGGLVLLDEFDSAIHYSVLADTWSKIAALANNYNCQVFVVTHSRECIKAALEGVSKGSTVKDFQYCRLERFDSELSAVTYTGDEVSESLRADWEIR